MDEDEFWNAPRPQPFPDLRVASTGRWYSLEREGGRDLHRLMGVCSGCRLVIYLDRERSRPLTHKDGGAVMARLLRRLAGWVTGEWPNLFTCPRCI